MKKVILNDELAVMLDLRDPDDNRRWALIIEAAKLLTPQGDECIRSVEYGDMIVIELAGIGKAVRSKKGEAVIVTPTVSDEEISWIMGDATFACPVCHSSDVHVGHLQSVTITAQEPLAVGGRIDKLRSCKCNKCGKLFWV